MKSSNRFLLGFGIALIVLVAITTTLVLLNRDNVSMLPENTPEGTVQRFLLAVQDQDFQKAYSYLQVEEKGIKLTYDDWLQSVSPPFQRTSVSWKATLGKTTVSGDTATVEVLINIFQPGGPFENPVRTQTEIYQLKQVNNQWFITTHPWLYWYY
jgi:hypothetical protein